MPAPQTPAPPPPEDDEGATPRELLMEAARRGNVDLLNEILNNGTTNAKFLNEAQDPIGNSALHVAAKYGSYEIVDILLDQEGLEVDSKNRMEQDTPLHIAVKLAGQDDRRDVGEHIVDLLLGAGADPRVKNKQGRKPLDLVDPRNAGLRSTLQRAEYAMMAGNDIVRDDDDDGPTGSNSDSE